MLRKKDVFDVIRVNKQQLKKLGIKKIGVFGSFSRSSQRRSSDVDILVEFKKGEKTFDNYMDTKFFLQKKLKRPVDLVIKSALKSRLKPYVLKEVEYARL